MAGREIKRAIAATGHSNYLGNYEQSIAKSKKLPKQSKS
jgi:hypothetical protein